MSEIAVRKDESRSKKIMIRVVSGAAMVRTKKPALTICAVIEALCDSFFLSLVQQIGVFLSCLFMGHIYICLLVALVELLLVRIVAQQSYWGIACTTHLYKF